MPLRICVLGSTLERAQALWVELANENGKHISKRTKSQIILDDGTYMKAFSVNGVKDRFDGQRFDQVFFDAQIHPRSILACRDAVYLALSHSYVPERFKFQPIYSMQGEGNT